MHSARLSTFENELVGRGIGLRMRAKLLIWQIERHDGGLGVDAIRRFELVKVCR